MKVSIIPGISTSTTRKKYTITFPATLQRTTIYRVPTIVTTRTIGHAIFIVNLGNGMTNISRHETLKVQLAFSHEGRAT